MSEDVVVVVVVVSQVGWEGEGRDDGRPDGPGWGCWKGKGGMTEKSGRD